MRVRCVTAYRGHVVGKACQLDVAVGLPADRLAGANVALLLGRLPRQQISPNVQPYPLPPSTTVHSHPLSPCRWSIIGWMPERGRESSLLPSSAGKCDSTSTHRRICQHTPCVSQRECIAFAGPLSEVSFGSEESDGAHLLAGFDHFGFQAASWVEQRHVKSSTNRCRN